MLSSPTVIISIGPWHAEVACAIEHAVLCEDRQERDQPNLHWISCWSDAPASIEQSIGSYASLPSPDALSGALDSVSDRIDSPRLHRLARDTVTRHLPITKVLKPRALVVTGTNDLSPSGNTISAISSALTVALGADGHLSMTLVIADDDAAPHREGTVPAYGACTDFEAVYTTSAEDVCKLLCPLLDAPTAGALLEVAEGLVTDRGSVACSRAKIASGSVSLSVLLERATLQAFIDLLGTARPDRQQLTEVADEVAEDHAITATSALKRQLPDAQQLRQEMSTMRATWMRRRLRTSVEERLSGVRACWNELSQRYDDLAVDDEECGPEEEYVVATLRRLQDTFKSEACGAIARRLGLLSIPAGYERLLSHVRHWDTIPLPPLPDDPMGEFCREVRRHERSDLTTRFEIWTEHEPALMHYLQMLARRGAVKRVRMLGERLSTWLEAWFERHRSGQVTLERIADEASARLTELDSEGAAQFLADLWGEERVGEAMHLRLAPESLATIRDRLMQQLGRPVLQAMSTDRGNERADGIFAALQEGLRHHLLEVVSPLYDRNGSMDPIDLHAGLNSALWATNSCGDEDERDFAAGSVLLIVPSPTATARMNALRDYAAIDTPYITSSVVRGPVLDLVVVRLTAGSH